MLKVYGFSKVNAGARGHTRDLRVLWALEPPLLALMVLDWTADGRRNSRSPTS
jgi:glutathione S-transferase